MANDQLPNDIGAIQPTKHPKTAHLNAPWKPGQSGNPLGRPKGKSLLHEIREVLDDTVLLGQRNKDGKTNRRVLAETAIRHAQLGRSAYFKEIMERLFGKVPLKVDTRVEVEPTESGIPAYVVDAMLEAGLRAAGEIEGPSE